MNASMNLKTVCSLPTERTIKRETSFFLAQKQMFLIWKTAHRVARAVTPTRLLLTLLNYSRSVCSSLTFG